MEDFHYLLARGELDVLVELVDELVKLDDARELDIFVLELHHEELLGAHELAGCAWLRLDLNLGGHVAPQVLELRVVIFLGVVPRHLVHLGVGALTLPLVGVDFVFLVLVKRRLDFDDVDALAIEVALDDRCRVEDGDFLDGLGARLDEECSTSVYLN